MRTAIAMICWAGLIAGPARATAQDRVIVDDTAACACQLRVELLTTLQDLDGRAGLSKPLVVERTVDSQYLVVPATRQSALLQFDESGAFDRSVGRPGQGPGEFRVILAIRPGPGDSTLVLDAGNRRLAVLDPRLNVARTARLPVIGGWFGALSNGGILVLSSIPGRNAETLDRLFLLGPSLGIERSFMPVSGRRPDTPIESLRRRMAVSGDGVVVVSHWRRYAIEVWRTDGTHVKTLVRRPSWFRAAGSGRADPLGPLQPAQEAPRISQDGQVWTVIHVPDAEWEESLGPTRTVYGNSGIGVPEGRSNDYYDSIVEVLDPESGHLIASARVDPHLTLISDAGYAASCREDRNGYPFVDVWRLEVVER